MNYVEKIKRFAAAHPHIDFYADRACEQEVLELLNYTESAVLPYTLESPLLKADGTKMKTASEWLASRRREVVELL